MSTTWNHYCQKFRFKHDSVLVCALYFVTGYTFWIGFESEKVESLYWYLEKTQVTV